ncbi:phosphoribosylformylglycinamidine synthase I [PVC group bacterium (ex Bugula neritina AB1)]|nr:phosphoribosylformylglycinamidine synthase I [PVC group bacterium (ex Bugula neritina AB1)]
MKRKVSFGVLVFPGSNCDRDCFEVIQNVVDQKASYIWHKETQIKNVDVIVIPGGFSYGDYLRCGAMASVSSIMPALKDFALSGGLVLGICNGFQILLETGLLPGAMQRNVSLKFICKDVRLRVEANDSPFSNKYNINDEITIPVAHHDGNYFPPVDGSTASKSRKLFSYIDNPNGSFDDIAGLTNEQGNVLGMMPHPERCSEEVLSGSDGLKIFESLIYYVQNS